jgi:hypothetical protein
MLNFFLCTYVHFISRYVAKLCTSLHIKMFVVAIDFLYNFDHSLYSKHYVVNICLVC